MHIEKTARDWYNEGVSKYTANDLEGSISCYDEAIELKPDGPLYHSNRANSLFKMNRFEEALASLDNADSLLKAGKTEGLSEGNINVVKSTITKRSEFSLQLKEYLESLEKLKQEEEKAEKLLTEYEAKKKMFFSLFLLLDLQKQLPANFPL